MCICCFCCCCCFTRKSLLIFSITISAITFSYSILVISNFGSKTDNYKLLKEKIDSYEIYISKSSRRLQSSYYNSYTYNRVNVFEDEDAEARYHLSLLNYNSFKNNSYGIIKRLKGIENGLGIILFIFPIIFLAAGIVYLFFSCGIGETQVLKTKIYNILYYLKITTYTLSIIFIFLSFTYGVLITVAIAEYFTFADAPDSCVIGMIYGFAFGYYGFVYYIFLACIFGRERQFFIEVGSEATPGARATYDINGNVIVRAAVIPQAQIIQLNPYIVAQPMNIPYQQVQVLNRNNQFAPMNQPSLEPINQPITQEPIIQQEEIKQRHLQEEQNKQSHIQQPQIQQEQIPQNQNHTSRRRLSNRQNNANNQ